MAIQRLALAVVIGAVIGSAALCPRRALADEQMVPLAASGDWVAVEHLSSETAAADVCAAATVASDVSFFLRADENDIEIRYEDKSWSLPAGVSGVLVIDVGSFHTSFMISDNTNSMVMAVISPEQLQSLISAMDKASSMTVTAGKSVSQTISLNGSNQATTAFLTCAGITAPGEGGGANPFK